MALGVRILSNNLSGQTTNVVYFPDTGGTIDLGTQVFPFNYLSSYYYIVSFNILFLRLNILKLVVSLKVTTSDYII